MKGDIPAVSVQVDAAALAQFMPMHLLLDDDGRVVSCGPTLMRVLNDGAVVGARFEELFEVRSPGGARTVDDVLSRGANRFRLTPRNGVRAGMRGLGRRLGAGKGRLPS